MDEPTNHCNECGLDFFYAPELHVCKHKGRALPGAEHDGESWVDECMRLQRDGRRA
jgi:hypothetical protein